MEMKMLEGCRVMGAVHIPFTVNIEEYVISCGIMVISEAEFKKYQADKAISYQFSIRYYDYYPEYKDELSELVSCGIGECIEHSFARPVAEEDQHDMVYSVMTNPDPCGCQHARDCADFVDNSFDNPTCVECLKDD